MMKMVRGFLALSLIVGGMACGDDHDHEDDDDGSEHVHGAGGCGNQENCDPDAPELSSGPMATGTSGTSFAVHMPSDYTHGPGTLVTATMMLHFMKDGQPLTNTAVTVNTWSEDCGHPGPDEDSKLTTNDQGMAMFKAAFAHGGPWSILVSEVDGMADEIRLELCVPGEAHGGGGTGDAGMVDHSQHMP